MKKLMVVIAALSVVGIASADLAVLLTNGTTPVTKVGSGGIEGVDDVLVQLVWSPTNTAQAGVGASLGVDEYLLNSMLVSGTWGTWNATDPDIYNDLLVGGNDEEDTVILGGYIFVRIFDNAATELDDYYLQQYIQQPVLTKYDLQNVATIYNTSGELGGDLDSTGHQVIPEPAVAGLIGIFGAGMIFARRMFSKDA